MRSRAAFITALQYILPFAAIVLFWIKGFIVLDPDFGWHLRMGELLLKSGIPATDPFSYTMPGYPVVDHEYLSNLIISRSYDLVGMGGTALVFALVAIIPLFTRFKEKDEGLLFLLGAIILGSFAGVRPQIFTWVFTGIFLSMLRGNVTVARRITLILLQMLWVQMHGGFFLGIIYILLYTVVSILKDRRLHGGDLLWLLVSTASTFANPYGWRIWWEIYVSLTDVSLRYSIGEWMSAFSFFNGAFWFYVMICCALMLRYAGRFTAFEKTTTLVLFIMSLLGMRNIPLFIIASLPLVIKGWGYLREEAYGATDGGGVWRGFARAFTLCAVLIAAGQAGWDIASWRSFSEANAYPAAAVSYIKNNALQKNILAYYGWGGYVLWKMPERKVFIDGRMPSWRQNPPDPFQSGNAFGEYAVIMREKEGYEKLLRKYNISHILLPVDGGEGTQRKRFKNMKIRFRDRVAVLYETGI